MLGFKGRALGRWVRGLGLSCCIKGQASWAGICKGHKNINGVKKYRAAQELGSPHTASLVTRRPLPVTCTGLG